MNFSLELKMFIVYSKIEILAPAIGPETVLAPVLAPPPRWAGARGGGRGAR